MKMKKILSTFMVALMTVAMVACGSKQQNTAAEDEAVVMNVDELLEQAPGLVDSTVTFEGVCSHTCRHGATKMFLIGTDDTKTIRVEACDLGSFDAKVIHQPVTVTGVLREQRIDEEYLAQWEEQVKAQTAKAHGEGNEAGCDTERAARGMESSTAEGQIAEYRARIAERDSLEGKPYVSFFYVDAKSYKIDER